MTTPHQPTRLIRFFMPGGASLPFPPCADIDGNTPSTRAPWEPGGYLVFTLSSQLADGDPVLAYWDGTDFVGIPRHSIVGWAGLSSPLVGD